MYIVHSHMENMYKKIMLHIHVHLYVHVHQETCTWHFNCAGGRQHTTNINGEGLELRLANGLTHDSQLIFFFKC